MTKGVNYRLKDGDTVVLTEPVPFESYWLPRPHGRGCWEAGHILAGTHGKVCKARTPYVTVVPGEPACFANVDVEVPGHGIIRIRPFHNALRKVRATCRSSTQARTTR